MAGQGGRARSFRAIGKRPRRRRRREARRQRPYQWRPQRRKQREELSRRRPSAAQSPLASRSQAELSSRRWSYGLRGAKGRGAGARAGSSSDRRALARCPTRWWPCGTCRATRRWSPRAQWHLRPSSTAPCRRSGCTKVTVGRSVRRSSRWPSASCRQGTGAANPHRRHGSQWSAGAARCTKPSPTRSRTAARRTVPLVGRSTRARWATLRRKRASATQRQWTI